MPRGNFTQRTRSPGYPKAPVRHLLNQVKRVLRAANMHKTEYRDQLIKESNNGNMGAISREYPLSNALLRDLYMAWDALKNPRVRDTAETES